MSGAEFHRRAMEDALTDAAEQSSVDRKAIAIAEAQVHATALLAEQQRIANLIAAYDRDALVYPAVNAVPHTERYALQRAEREAFEARIAGEVTEGLGLA